MLLPFLKERGLGLLLALGLLAPSRAGASDRPLVALAADATPAEQAAAWVEVLARADSGAVLQARGHLLNLQQHAIGPLIELMAREELVALEGTADLIYPGADRLYGHGWVVPYDIDWLPVRAGWVFEELVHESLGFDMAGSFGAEGAMVAFTADWSRLPPEQRTLEARAAAGREAAERARRWRAAHPDWTCLGAVREGLHSEERRDATMAWLRSGRGACEGLTREVYLEELRPLVAAASEADGHAATSEAWRLLRDVELHWLSIKGQSLP